MDNLLVNNTWIVLLREDIFTNLVQIFVKSHKGFFPLG